MGTSLAFMDIGTSFLTYSIQMISNPAESRLMLDCIHFMTKLREVKLVQDNPSRLHKATYVIQ